MQNPHISALQTKHADLDARISEENTRPHPDYATLARLEARPVATMTVEAQESHERNERISRDD